MEVLEECFVVNDYMGSMRRAYLDFKDPQEVHKGQYFVNSDGNSGATDNYLLIYQFTEGYRHLHNDPIHCPGEDRENIPQFYAILDSLLPRETMSTLRNYWWLNDHVINCFLKLISIHDEIT